MWSHFSPCAPFLGLNWLGIRSCEDRQGRHSPRRWWLKCSIGLGKNRGRTRIYFAILAILGCYLQDHMAHFLLFVSVYFASLSAITVTYRLSPFYPLSSFPGPLGGSISSATLVAVSFGGVRHLVLDDLHKRYGKFVRIGVHSSSHVFKIVKNWGDYPGPNTLSVNSLTVQNVLYGSTHYMLQGDSYKKPGRIGGVAMFWSW